MLLCAALFAVQTTHLTLYRGSPLPGSETRYWSAEDTSLEREHPERSYGQGLLDWAGKDKRILIRFGDLQRAFGPLKRVVSARLVMPVESVAQAGTVKLQKFTARWNEGPGFGEAQPIPLQWATTYAYQFFDKKSKPKAWRNGGAEFVSSQPSATAELALGQKEVVFDGLAADVQGQYEKWYENNGWAIEATCDSAFNSAQDGSRGPRLEVELQDATETGGADLSVVCIRRTPEYERYDNRGDAYQRKTVDGHESGVMMNPGGDERKKWPADGEEVTYTAVVKNVGNANSGGFSYQWQLGLDAPSGGSFETALPPGQSAQVTFKAKFKADNTDHRTQPVSLLIRPGSADAHASNDFLEVQANALNLGIWVDEGFYKKFSEAVNGAGTRSFEDWIQWQFRIWNDVFMRHSRFSFAQDGCRESVRVGNITIVPDGTLKGGAHLPNDAPTLVYDGEWGFDSSFGDPMGYIKAVRNQADRALIHEMSHHIGLIDMYQMNVDPSLPDGSGGKVRLKWNGAVLSRGEFDAFGGLMGGGDTRNDGLIPTQLPIAQTLIESPAYSSALFVPTDLYAMTDVGALNANLGFRRGFFGEYIYSIPEIVMLRVTNAMGETMETGKLSFYQMKGGAIQDGAPDFELAVKDGVAMLPSRATGLDAPFTTATGHTLRPNPFGRIDVVGSNGVMLVRLDAAGQTEWAWLKLWQLVDVVWRGNKRVFVQELRFNTTDRPLLEKDWALKKIVIDKANSSGANLAALVDGDGTTTYSASGDVGDWVEIDIGRDRPIGEIKLLVDKQGAAFWKQFDVMVYGTGQTVSQARVFSKELDWGSAVSERRDVDAKDFSKRSVAYRGRAQTVRFIRLVNKGGGKGVIAGIEIREVEPQQ